MTEERMLALKNAGVDVDGSISRFSGNTALYEKFLLKFVSDTSFQGIVDAFAASDYESARSPLHTLKGVAGNLGITNLYELSSDALTAIHANDPERAIQYFDKMKKAYAEIIDTISSERQDHTL